MLPLQPVSVADVAADDAPHDSGIRIYPNNAAKLYQVQFMVMVVVVVVVIVMETGITMMIVVKVMVVMIDCGP